jgi:hypothetical protein
MTEIQSTSSFHTAEGNPAQAALLSFFEPQMRKLTGPLMTKMTQLVEKIYARKDLLAELETHVAHGTMPTHIPRAKLPMVSDHDKSFAQGYEANVKTFQGNVLKNMITACRLDLTKMEASKTQILVEVKSTITSYLQFKQKTMPGLHECLPSIYNHHEAGFTTTLHLKILRYRLNAAQISYSKKQSRLEKERT